MEQIFKECQSKNHDQIPLSITYYNHIVMGRPTIFFDYLLSCKTFKDLLKPYMKHEVKVSPSNLE